MLELITVLAIMIIIMSSAVVSIVGMRRGAEMRSGMSSLRTTIALARQSAVTKREKVTVHFAIRDTGGNGRDFWLSNDTGTISETNHLSLGLEFARRAFGYTASSSLEFRPTGGSGSASNAFVIIGEVSGTQTNILKIYGLTGQMRTELSM